MSVSAVNTQNVLKNLKFCPFLRRSSGEEGNNVFGESIAVKNNGHFYSSANDIQKASGRARVLRIV